MAQSTASTSVLKDHGIVGQHIIVIKTFIPLQAVVDAEGNFLIVYVGAPGRYNDAGVFIASNFGRRLIDKQLNLPVPGMLYPEKISIFHTCSLLTNRTL